MHKEYYLVESSALPDYLVKVMQVKELLREDISISDACKKIRVSRSTYYKYKDLIHLPTNQTIRRMIVSLKLVDETGVLSNVLNFVANNGGNVLAINQQMPIHSIAFVTLSIDAIHLMQPTTAFISEMKELNKVVDVVLVSIE